MTLEEVGNNKDEKKYINKCELCAFETVGSKRYIAIRLLAKHKETCKGMTCAECDFCVMDKIIMKKPTRDQHAISTCSTSPPLRKRKVVVEKDVTPEPMEVEEQSVVDLSESLEDMDIGNSEEVLIKERSKLNDDRIKEKERKNAERELLHSRKTIEALYSKSK